MTDRATQLAEIATRWSTCQACSLAGTRRCAAPLSIWRSDGGSDLDADAAVLVIGESPGVESDGNGVVMAGVAGDLVRREYLAASGVRQAVLTTLVACRPPAGKVPTPDQVAACRPRLGEILSVLAPVGVVTIGRMVEVAVTPPSGPGLIPAKLPKVALVDPVTLLRAGWPNLPAASQRTLAAIKAKVLRLLQKADLAPRDRREVAATGDCQHQPVKAGCWRDDAGNDGGPIYICRKCGLFVQGDQ